MGNWNMASVFSAGELLSGCPTTWRMSPVAANKRIPEEMIPYFPLGVYKELEGDGTCGSLIAPSTAAGGAGEGK
jgi:2-oxoglutarate ferredoxin oxidoreductase subunit beta